MNNFELVIYGLNMETKNKYKFVSSSLVGKKSKLSFMSKYIKAVYGEEYVEDFYFDVTKDIEIDFSSDTFLKLRFPEIISLTFNTKLFIKGLVKFLNKTHPMLKVKYNLINAYEITEQTFIENQVILYSLSDLEYEVLELSTSFNLDTMNKDSLVSLARKTYKALNSIEYPEKNCLIDSRYCEVCAERDKKTPYHFSLYLQPLTIMEHTSQLDVGVG